MTKLEYAQQLLTIMIDKDWQFPMDETLATPMPDQWDQAATKRALYLASLLEDGCK